MSDSETLAAADHTVPLDSQVGGHPGVLTSEDGSLLIKPALAPEVAFYQSVAADPAFAPLRPFIPKFYGTLRLEGKVQATETAEGEPIAPLDPADGAKDDHDFLKPNILDVKLGTVLYDDSASPEKRARMEKTARETTSLETGVRLTGFQVYDLSSGKAINTPKSYGKSIKPSDLPDGIARFFPIAPDSLPPPPPPADSEQTTTHGTGLPVNILLPVLQSLREDIAEIRAALAEVHLRMVGGSLLIIYESDWDRAQRGLTWLEEHPDHNEEEDEDEEDDDDDEESTRPGPPYLVKLIDFAHTKLETGIGPDEGVLKGVDTVLGLLDGRIEQVKAAVHA